MSTWFFDHVTELIRKRLTGKIPIEALAAIYHPKDEAHLNFLALDAQPAEVFNAFCVAAHQANADDAKFGQDALWDEILSRLRADSRWREA